MYKHNSFTRTFSRVGIDGKIQIPCVNPSMHTIFSKSWKVLIGYSWVTQYWFFGWWHHDLYKNRGLTISWLCITLNDLIYQWTVENIVSDLTLQINCRWILMMLTSSDMTGFYFLPSCLHGELVFLLFWWIAGKWCSQMSLQENASRKIPRSSIVEKVGEGSAFLYSPASEIFILFVCFVAQYFLKMFSID